MPRAGRSSVGALSSGGGFSDPFSDQQQGRVYTPPTGGGSSGDSGFTPGGFGVDVTSPGAFVASMQQNTQEGEDFVAGLGAALFGQDNDSMFGGLPVVGDLGRFVGDNPVVSTLYKVPGAAADAIGGGLERVSIGDNTDQYNQLPPDIRAEFDKKIAELPEAANHFRFDALRANAERQQLVEPNAFPTFQIPPGSLADGVGWLLGDLLGAPQRLTERAIAGAGKVSGMNRLQEIDAIARGGVPTGVLGTGLFAGDRNLTEVEQITYEKWRSGEWSADQAFDFLAASGSGLSRDQALQIAGTFATDPTIALSLGAAGLARLGVTGARLAAKEAATAQRLLAGGGRLSRTEVGTDLVRLLSKPYVGIQNTALGTAAKATRYIIDPLHAIGQQRVAQEALVDIASEATPRAVASAYGEANHLNVLHYAREVGERGELYDMLTEDIATYGANVARRVLAEQHQAAMLANGLGYDLLQSLPGDIVDDLAQGAPKGFAGYIKDEVAKHRVLVWDEAAKSNLARRLEAMYAFKSADEYLADISKMNPDELGLLHAATYGRATKNLLNALGQAAGVYTGDLPLNRLVLLNRDTLTTLGAHGILDRIKGAATMEAALAEMKAAQELYPELRYVSIDAMNPARSVERFAAWLDNRLADGIMPAQVTTDELASLPEPLRQLADQIGGAWTLGFRPEDHLLWGLEFNLDGTYRAATVPWVDHVADAVPAFRAGRVLSTNLAGQPIVGAIARKAAKPLDYIEAGRRTMTAKVSSAAITEGARARFVASAVGKAGMTEQEARAVFQGIVDVAQLQKTTARGLTETNMWEQARHLVPQRMRLTGFGKRELMALVLDAYEGDLRFVGLTQKFTGRAKKLLQPLGGNVAGYIAENLYPTVKFRLNPIFQLQERIEPIVLNAQRGVHFAFGNKLSEADRLTEGILQRMVDTSIVRAGDIDQLEFSAMALFGDEAKQVLTGHVARDYWNTISDVQGVKRLNMLRTFQKGLGSKLRTVWERNAPGAWADIVNEMSAKAGRVVSDDEAAIRYLSEQMLANEVNVNRLIQPGARAADFDAAINTAAWHVPATLGELKPLELDFLAKRMQFPVEGGKVLLNSADLRAALADGRLQWDAIEDALSLAGAHPDYVRRVQAALEFSWDGFWHAARQRYGLTPEELNKIQRMMGRSAELRGMKPVEFVSQVFSPYIASGSEATIEELGKAVSILRAPLRKDGRASGTAEHLMTQLADVFTAHLDPSAQRTLLDVFERELPGDIQAAFDAGKAKAGQGLQRTLENLRRGWTKETNGAFARRVLDYMDAPPVAVAEPIDFARFGRDARGNATTPKAFKSEPGYVYRTANERRLASDWRVGEYAAGHPATIYAESDSSVVMRVRETEGFEPATGGVNASDNMRARAAIPADRVEVLAADGTWHPALSAAVGETDPDVLRAVQQFSKWSQSALQDGLLSAGTANPYSELLTRVSGIATDLAAPFNYTEQMLVNQATHAMRLKEQDAFRLTYFARDRSWLERSINHPFFGIYPASYMWGKIAPEVIRFVAKEPFGIKTGALAYSLTDVQKAMAIQAEFDPEFSEEMEKIGKSQSLWFAGYLLPSVPWDIGAAMPAWMRDIADQGLDNQNRVAKGQEPKAIDLGRPLRKVADYVSPFRSALQVERVLDEVLEEPEDGPQVPTASLPIGPLKATELGPTLEETMAELRQVLANQ